LEKENLFKSEKRIPPLNVSPAPTKKFKTKKKRKRKIRKRKKKEVRKEIYQLCQ
jgi:hypothetical protein